MNHVSFKRVKQRASLYAYIGVILVLMASLAANAVLLHERHKAALVTPVSKADQYPMLAKRIFSENPNDILIDFLPLRTALRQYSTQFSGGYSLYFEYLFTGSSVRLDSSEDEGIVAASLIKLPIVMNMYRAVELGRLNLDQEVTIRSDWLDKDFGDLWKQGAGTKITLRRAAELALRKSDNTAIRVIQESVVPVMNDGEFALQAIDVEHEINDGQYTTIRAKDYSAILKCLYFACFVNEDHSQQILMHLSGTPFSDELAAGVPSTIRVAHKIGVFGDKAESDCGIVYLPERPYLLCMMLETTKDEAKIHMSTISKLVYQYVSDSER